MTAEERSRWSVKLDRLRLRFRDPALESAYRADRYRHDLGNIRFGFLAGIAIWVAWGLLLRPYMLALSDQRLDVLMRFGVFIPMLIVGLNPGPEMLKSRLDVTFSMVWVLILSNIIVAALCFLILNHLAALTFIRGSLLIPFLLFLVFIGSFTANNDLYDIVATLLFGFIGYCMVKFGWPRPPLILGLTLGKIAENYLWISTAAYGAKWLMFPSVLILIAITIFTIAYPTIKERMGRARYERPADAL